MATATGDSVGLTGDPRLDGLLQGGSWVFDGPQVLTVSFNLNFDITPRGAVVPAPGGTWEANPALANAFNRALAAWSNVAGISFQTISSGSYIIESQADIAVALTGGDLLRSSGAVALGFFPDPAYASTTLTEWGYNRSQYPRPEGDVLLDNFYSGFTYLGDGGFGLWAMIHELGHALGLKHPFDNGGNDRPTFVQGLIGQYDNERYTVMSYSGVGNMSSGHAATLMPLDILAIQQLYGANTSFHTGDDRYLPVVDGAMRTIWDAGGNDTLDASAWSNGINLNLSDGALMDLGLGTVLGIAYNAGIEAAVGGSGNDSLTGSDANNLLRGNAGADSLFGGSGNDTLLGGDGADLFSYAAGGNGVDRIGDLSVGDAIQIAGSSFTGLATLGNGTALQRNQVQISVAAGNTTLFAGTDDTAGADIQLVITGSHDVSEFQLAGSQIHIVPPIRSVAFQAYSWKEHTLLGGVNISTETSSTNTDAQGQASLAGIPGTALPLGASRVVPAGEAAATAAAVNLQDAMVIMRMVVGLDANDAGRALSPYQALAADFDGDGQVALADALAVLRFTVGLPAPAPFWHFADEADFSMPQRATLNPGPAPSIFARLDGVSPVHVGLVGYLKGDVDGSFAGAAGAQDLDVIDIGYFSSLIATHPALSLSQFGIYTP